MGSEMVKDFFKDQVTDAVVDNVIHAEGLFGDAELKATGTDGISYTSNSPQNSIGGIGNSGNIRYFPNNNRPSSTGNNSSSTGNNSIFDPTSSELNRAAAAQERTKVKIIKNPNGTSSSASWFIGH